MYFGKPCASGNVTRVAILNTTVLLVDRCLSEELFSIDLHKTPYDSY